MNNCFKLSTWNNTPNQTKLQQTKLNSTNTYHTMPNQEFDAKWQETRVVYLNTTNTVPSWYGLGDKVELDQVNLVQLIVYTLLL